MYTIGLTYPLGCFILSVLNVYHIVYGASVTEHDKKKERVIHARVSESLDRELKDRASQLGVSVSKLVRNVLQNTFGLVDGIIADSAHVARAASRLRRPEDAPEPPLSAATAPSPSPPITPKIIGFQELVLNLNALCSQCNDILPRGTRAAVAVLDPPVPHATRTVICTPCLQEISHDPQPDNT